MKLLTRIRRIGWQNGTAIVWLALLVFAAVWSFFLPAYLLAPDLRNTSVPPLTHQHWLGTDPLGQDVWCVLLYGARTTLLVSLPAAALATTLGTVLGLLAGYYGNTRLRFAVAYWLAIGLVAISLLVFQSPQAGIAGMWWPLMLGVMAFLLGKQLQRFPLFRWLLAFPVDQLVLAAMTLLAALPRLLLVLTMAAVFEPTLSKLVLLLALTSWTQSARLIRAEVRRLLALPYLEAAHSIGLPSWRIVRYHLLPNAWRPVITTFPLSIAVFIALETTLSFLGIGLPPETPSWGKLLALSRLSPSSWWLLFFPGICLLATTLSLRQLLALNKSINPS